MVGFVTSDVGVVDFGVSELVAGSGVELEFAVWVLSSCVLRSLKIH